MIIAAMGMVTSVRQLLLARCLQGLFAGFTPMAMALASVSAPQDKVSVAIARVQGAQLLSVAVGPAVGGLVAAQLGTRRAFFMTAARCAVALIALTFLFHEARPLAPRQRRVRGATPLREFLRYPYFLTVALVLLIAQFVDRGLALMIPLHVAHLADVPAIAATSGVIISMAAIAAAISASMVARLSEAFPIGRLLVSQFVVGGAFCAAMALAGNPITLLLLRTMVAICLGGAMTLAYSLGGMIVPGETRASAFGWLGVGVQIGTAASPLLAGALAWVAAVVLVFSASELLKRREPWEAAPRRSGA